MKKTKRKRKLSCIQEMAYSFHSIPPYICLCSNQCMVSYIALGISNCFSTSVLSPCCLSYPCLISLSLYVGPVQCKSLIPLNFCMSWGADTRQQK